MNNVRTTVFTIFGILCLLGCQQPRQAGLALYTVENPAVLPGSTNAFWEGSITASPLLTDEDFIGFGADSLSFRLSAEGAKALEGFQTSMEPKTVVLTLDRNPVLGFWLWGKYSSLGCDWLVGTMNAEVLKLRKGLPRSHFADSLYTDEWVRSVTLHLNTR